MSYDICCYFAGYFITADIVDLVRLKGPPCKGLLELRKQKSRQIVEKEDRDDEWLPSSNTDSKYICKVLLVTEMLMVIPCTHMHISHFV